MKWTAYCITCHKNVYEAPNGTMVEAAAHIHTEDNPFHYVIVGQIVKNEPVHAAKEVMEFMTGGIEEL